MTTGKRTAWKRILLLERGGYVRRERATWDPRAVNVEDERVRPRVLGDGVAKALQFAIDAASSERRCERERVVEGIHVLRVRVAARAPVNALRPLLQ